MDTRAYCDYNDEVRLHFYSKMISAEHSDPDKSDLQFHSGLQKLVKGWSAVWTVALSYSC